MALISPNVLRYVHNIRVALTSGRTCEANRLLMVEYVGHHSKVVKCLGSSLTNNKVPVASLTRARVYGAGLQVVSGGLCERW